MIKLIKSTFFNEQATKESLTKFIMKSPILSFSKQCERFEKKFAAYQGRKEAVFVNSGSSANLAMLQALINIGQLKAGDSVGFSALTWSTNTMPLIQLGLRPVPIDVELDTLNVSLRLLKQATRSRTRQLKALFLTNLLGFCDDIDAIQRYCKEAGIVLIEDNCESLGSEYQGKKLGNYGLASSFSFYVGHHMSTIEGGMVCTDDEDFATMLRLVRAHGWDRNLAYKHRRKIRSKFQVNSSFYSRYTFYDLGYNLRPTEIAGFLGNNQLKHVPTIIKRRQENFARIASALYSKTDRYYPVRYDHMDFLSNFAVPVICKSVALRDELVKKCANKIEIRPIVGGDMTQQPFFGKYVKNYREKTATNSKLIHQQGLYFGNNPDMTAAEIEFIIKTFS